MKDFRSIVVGLVRAAHAERVVEVGCWLGDLSRRLWKESCIQQLSLVDPLTVEGCNPVRNGRHYHMSMNDAGNMSQEELDQVYARFIADIPLHVFFYRMTSVEASKSFRDESLDFVFIDALHFYENVKEDIEIWIPKIRNGGMIAGDDFSDAGRFMGVKQAVSELLPHYNRNTRVWWAEVLHGKKI